MHRDRGLFTQRADLFVKEVEKAAGNACARGFQALAITDDIAGKGGLFFSPDYFAQAVWPVYRQAAEIAKGAGLRAFFHSDGDTRKVIDLLIKAGYDCIHPVDAQAGLDVDGLVEEFGQAVCLMGHIDIMGWGRRKDPAGDRACGREIQGRRTHTRLQLRHIDGDHGRAILRPLSGRTMTGKSDDR